MKRWEEIKEILFREGKVFVADLSQRYQVSEVSIRKDLTKLENEDLRSSFTAALPWQPPITNKATESVDFYQDPIRLALAKRAGPGNQRWRLHLPGLRAHLLHPGSAFRQQEKPDRRDQ
jgi:hypothetical protein